MRRFLRYLRIAFSATCLIACVLLIVLWIKSNWCADCVVHIKSGIQTTIAAANGVVVIRRVNLRGAPIVIPDLNWTHTASYPPSDYRRPGFIRRPGFDLQIQSPVWVPVLLMAAFTIAPWIKWSKRFSLRTLLIATTLVALVLGLAVWASR
jgi:hypothetical protein